jgi:uncharacterized protein YyaL (SSP411 family)
VTQGHHANRLADEKSPYLLQHARNPVDWYPWGEEAFEKARRENKPIFLSIGYSTCHWCHVMAHESFESENVAEVMNREFVNIKVDREERPDVDRVYMTFVQATTGHGGWPMSVWLTPELRPFVGGTYFPPEDRYGHPAFKKLLERIAAAWKQDRDKIENSGEQIVEALREAQAREPDTAGSISAETFDSAFEQLDRMFDPVEGGFGNAPKFPHPVTLNFLSRYYARQRGIGGTPRNGAQTEHRRVADATSPSALDMILLTLRKMAAGGVHDHIGGGFHRYSVDRYWHVPHFEKMLYDQAQLAIAYLDACQITEDSEFASVARDILDYVLRDMTSPEGGFFSAEDADSPIPVAAVYDRRASEPEDYPGAEDSGGHRPSLQKAAEGAFYVWTQGQIDVALGDASDTFNFHYGVQLHGNVPEGSDPHDEFPEKNILIQRHTVSETAQHFSKTDSEIEKSLSQSRSILFDIRSKRPRPHLDDKILASWNGLMISAFARAAQVLDEPDYLQAAERAATFIRNELYDQSGKLLYRSFRHGRSNIEGFADDYAFVIQGLLDLYEASFDVSWLKFAVELQQTMDDLFCDKKNGGYFSSSGKDKTVFLRMKDDNDSAEPAPSSVAALNLLRLAQIRNEPKYRERAEKTISAFSATLSRFPSAMPQMLVAVDFSLSKPRQIVIAGNRGAEDTKVLVAEVHRHFLPNKVLLLADDAEGQKYLSQTNEAIRSMSPINGKSAVYVCENFTCEAPGTDPKRLHQLLSR